MATADNGHVSRKTKFILALGEFGPSVGVGTIVPFYLLYFMTDVAGMRPALAGGVLLFARLWDAINDPLVGNLSDRTRSRWGRRRPYMLFGAVPMGILFALLWFVPPFSDAGKAVYYLVVYWLFDTSFTIVTAPYTALTPEITLDADERTSIITWRMAVSIITGLMAAVAMDFVFSAMPSLQVGFAVMGIAVGFLSILPYFWIFVAIEERAEYQGQAGFKFIEGVRLVLTNRAYLLSLMADIFAWTAIATVEAVFAYYLIYWGGIPQEESPIVMAMILASASICLPAVLWLAGRFEKNQAFIICTGTWALVHVALWFIPQNIAAPIYVVAAIAGLGVAGAHVLPGAMSIDVLESVELESGGRQEGIFVGTSNFGRKLAISIALFLIGIMLEKTGYVANATQQADAALTGIRMLISWIPVAMLGASMLAAYAFPITREVHAGMLEELSRRRAESSAD